MGCVVPLVLAGCTSAPNTATPSPAVMASVTATAESAVAANPSGMVANPSGIPDTEWVRLAATNHALGALDAAVENLTQALAQKPDSPAWLTFRASIYTDQHDYVRALQDLDRVITLAPTATAYYERGRAHLSRHSLAHGDIAAAIRDYSAALKLRPDYPEALFGRASAYFDSGDYSAAIAEFTTVIHLGTYRLAAAHGYRGQARHRNGEFYAALADLTLAIELAPSDHRQLLRRSEVFRGLKNMEGALRDANRALAMCRDDEVLFARGTLFYHMQRYDDAIADMEEALAQKPAAEGFKDLALVKLAKGDLSGALVATDEALRLDPKNAPALRLRYAVKARKQDHAGAQAELDAYLALEPDSVEALMWRGEYRYNGGRVDCAAADFERAIVLAPTNPQAYYGRGIAFIRAGEPKKSLPLFAQASALNPRFTKAYSGRAEAYMMLHDYAAALAAAQEGLAAVPDSNELHYDVASAYYMLKDYARAIEACDRFLKHDSWGPARELRERAERKLRATAR